jgi:hypothetical protein
METGSAVGSAALAFRRGLPKAGVNAADGFMRAAPPPQEKSPGPRSGAAAVMKAGSDHHQYLVINGTS